MRRPLALLLLVLAALAQGAEASDAGYLDISISVFEQNLPADPLMQERRKIYPRVREAESRYMPAYLARRLLESGRWGAVRVVPEPDQGADLRISGRIIQADGERLELAIAAVDSTGRQWIDRHYQGDARPGVSLTGTARAEDPFRHVYSEIAGDLAAVLDTLPDGEPARIQSVAFLRYGTTLSPRTFSDYLRETPEGRYTYSRLPADDDPMRQRVAEIRRREYLFIDVVDEEYRRFYEDIKPVYDRWREYRREERASSSAFEARKADGGNDFRRGSYRALRQSYDNYRWAQQQQQYLDEMATGFANEIETTEISLEDTIYSLSGTREQQYREWKAILRELFELESGEAP